MDAQAFPPPMIDAVAALDVGEHIRALALFDQAEAALGERADLCWLRGLALLAMNVPGEADQQAKRAVELDDACIGGWRLLADTAWRHGRLGQAQQALQRVVELADDPGPARGAYALFLAQERGPRLAEEAALQALAEAPLCADAWAALGVAQLRMNRPAEARSSLARALELDDDNNLYRAFMVWLLYRTGEHDRARRWAELMDDDPWARDFVERMRQAEHEELVNQKLLERSLPEVDQYVPQKPGDPWYLPTPSRWLVWAGVLFVGVAVPTLLTNASGSRGISTCAFLGIVSLYALTRWAVTGERR